MTRTLTARSSLSSDSETVVIDRIPDTCPICHRAGTPQVIRPVLTREFRGSFQQPFHGLEVALQCPAERCAAVFIAYYKPVEQAGTVGEVRYFLEGAHPFVTRRKEFTRELRDLSPRFEVIYNQALEAQQRGLDEIAGPGYRKALEFLVKDFAIDQHPDDKEEIKNRSLGRCLADYIDDDRLRKTAERAAWLGNDEVHYLRKWTDKDIEHLLLLLDLTVNWIEITIQTDRFERDMPDSGT